MMIKTKVTPVWLISTAHNSEHVSCLRTSFSSWINQLFDSRNDCFSFTAPASVFATADRYRNGFIPCSVLIKHQLISEGAFILDLGKSSVTKKRSILLWKKPERWFCFAFVINESVFSWMCVWLFQWWENQEEPVAMSTPSHWQSQSASRPAPRKPLLHWNNCSHYLKYRHALANRQFNL